MPGFFVTGTDTGVGKTVVSALLTLAIPEACYWKPIQSGTTPSTDRADVAQWTGLPEARLLPETYRLALPASPHVSAAAEGVEIRRSRLVPPAGYGSSLGPLIAEGAGGVLVPINASETMRDLMGWLGLPIVVVARTSLGTINHTLLTLEALRARALPVAALILNGEPVPTTTATLRRWGGVARLIELPPALRLDPDALRHTAASLPGLQELAHAH